MNPAAAPINVCRVERRGFAPPEAGDEPGQDEGRPAREQGAGRRHELRTFLLREVRWGAAPHLPVGPLADKELEIPGRIRTWQGLRFYLLSVIALERIPDALHDRQRAPGLAHAMNHGAEHLAGHEVHRQIAE